MQDTRKFPAAIAFAVAALGLSLAAQAQPVSPKRDATPRGAVGATGGVLEHEESTGGRILYFEETGGMATAVPSPVKPKPANGQGNVNGSVKAPVNGGGSASN